jgi:hypothetical protein
MAPFPADMAGNGSRFLLDTPEASEVRFAQGKNKGKSLGKGEP